LNRSPVRKSKSIKHGNIQVNVIPLQELPFHAGPLLFQSNVGKMNLANVETVIIEVIM